MHTCIRAYIHTYIQTQYMHTYMYIIDTHIIHTYTVTHIPAKSHSYIHRQGLSLKFPNMHVGRSEPSCVGYNLFTFYPFNIAYNDI